MFHLDPLGLLQVQHRYYTSELIRTHRVLAQQYRKLASIEQALVKRQERQLTRKDKKKLQWSRALTKKDVSQLESQQLWLHEYLRQCDDLMGSYNSPLQGGLAAWTSYTMPPSYPLPIDACSWSTGSYQIDQVPQYWDLPMLPERRASSPCAPSADSGFYEAPMYAQPFGLQELDDPDHLYANELMAGLHNTNGSSSMAASENDNVPELITPTSPTKTGAEPKSPLRRRYSENAIRLIEGRLAAGKTHPSRNRVGGIPILSRTVSDHYIKRDNVAGGDTGCSIASCYL